MKTVCLVTEELAGLGVSGGIGAAFYELALSLASHGHNVDLLFFPPYHLDEAEKSQAVQKLLQHHVRLIVPDISPWVWDTGSYSARSYGLYEYLKASRVKYDAIHFHDYKGLGFFSCTAKKQGLAFSDTALVVQLHGPTLWTTESNMTLFSSYEQVQVDFLEQRSIETADYVVSPSAYLFDWLRERGVKFPKNDRCRVIQNARTYASRAMAAAPVPSGDRVDYINEIVFFGRHEDRKGLTTFCDAISLIADELRASQTQVTFLGRIGTVNNEHSGLYLTRKSRDWDFRFNFIIGLDRFGANAYLTQNKHSLVVIPSNEENSPYTVLEALALHKPVLTSVNGGARELIADAYHDDTLCVMNAQALAKKLAEAIETGTLIPTPSKTAAEVEQEWLSFHDEIESKVSKPAGKDISAAMPKVVFGITHYERPQKVLSAIFSAIRQTYKNIEIVVVDDGSKRPETLKALDEIESLLSRVGGKLLRRENGYLGAARNTIAQNTSSDYLVFLDDDDIALPDLVETLVSVGKKTGADVVNCFNLYMPEDRRVEAEIMPESFKEKVSYTPIGGPLSTVLVNNTLGACTALISRELYTRVGGYTELHGVGYEDYEFYFKALQSGAKIEIAPVPLYLYEVGRPSMLSTTPTMRNMRRVFDSCEFDKNSDAWKTFAGVSVLQNALQSAESRRVWEISQSPYREQIETVLATRGYPIEVQAEALASFASAVGNSAAEQAWNSAGQTPMLETIQETGQKASLKRKYQLTPVSHVGVSEEPWLADARLLLALNRPVDAAESYVRILKDKNFSTQSTLALARYIAQQLPLDAPVAADLYDVVFDKDVDDSFEVDFLATLILIASRGGRLTEAEKLIQHINKDADEDYLRENPDVAEAVRAGTMPSPRMHFKLHGFFEGRTGYDMMEAIAGILRSHGQHTAHGWDAEALIIKDKPVPARRIATKLKSLVR